MTYQNTLRMNPILLNQMKVRLILLLCILFWTCTYYMGHYGSLYLFGAPMLFWQEMLLGVGLFLTTIGLLAGAWWAIAKQP